MLYNAIGAQYHETDQVQVLSLKYRDDSYAFDYFLPKENVGLAKFLASVTGTELQNLLSMTTRESVYVSFSDSKCYFSVFLFLPSFLFLFVIFRNIMCYTYDLS